MFVHFWVQMQTTNFEHLAHSAHVRMRVREARAKRMRTRIACSATTRTVRGMGTKLSLTDPEPVQRLVKWRSNFIFVSSYIAEVIFL